MKKIQKEVVMQDLMSSPRIYKKPDPKISQRNSETMSKSTAVDGKLGNPMLSLDGFE